MAEPNINNDNKNGSVNTLQIRSIMEESRERMELSLNLCAHCCLCAESCFLYENSKDPKYMPSHKFIHSIGTLYKKNGMVNMRLLEEIGDIVWNRCVLCTRCYCPFGIDIPEMISLARQICRSQGVFRQYEEG